GPRRSAVRAGVRHEAAVAGPLGTAGRARFRVDDAQLAARHLDVLEDAVDLPRLARRSVDPQVLPEAGLIVGEKRGRWMWWQIVPERVAALRATLALPA
ncbi:MAG TPA: hypothetical protein VKD67_08625, partial [Acidimicrobiales bacterium]|nr:hypothetical protein [Acidimicrobiales bacterium]